MSRLLYNNSSGLLGASLTSGGTTITFATAPSWPSIVASQPNGGDYIPLILEPSTSSGTPGPNFEIVYVTAYTAGATTATIQRGCEGTTGVAHANGVVWTHTLTAWDQLFGKGADAPWAGTLGDDYEFLNPGSSLPSGWAWINQQTGDTYAEYLRSGQLTLPSRGDFQTPGIYRSAPAAPFTVTAKLNTFVSSGNYPASMLMIYDGSKAMGVGYWGANRMMVNIFPLNGSSYTTLVNMGWYGLQATSLYHRIVYTSSTSASAWISVNGLSWLNLWSGNPTANGLGTPTNIGVAGTPNGAAVTIDCEWFRVR